MRTIAIINQKGGSGKTTTAINLAASLARREQRTLLVDLDPQGHCALGLAIPEIQIDLQVGDAMLVPDARPLDWSRLLWRVSRDLDLLPSTTKLAALEAARGGLADREDRDGRLASLLVRLADQYDWCLIDCSPSIGLLTFNALRAAAEVLIPVETAFFALQGAGKQVSTLQAVCRRFGAPTPFWILPTLHDCASTLAGEVLNELQRRFSEHLLPVVIRQDPRLKEAASMGVPVVELDGSSPGAEDYETLAAHLITTRPASGRAGAGTHTAHPVVVPARHRDEFRAAHSEVDPVLMMVDAASPGRAGARAEPMTRAAELAARARRLAARSAELSKRLEADPDVAAVLREIERPHAERRADPILYEQRAPSLSRVFGVQATSRGMLFVQPGDPGNVICIAGEHNAWSPATSPMRYNPDVGVHETCLSIPTGRWRYRLVINGRWTTDPHNPLREPNPYGEEDSVVVVPPTAVVTTPPTSAAV